MHSSLEINSSTFVYEASSTVKYDTRHMIISKTITEIDIKINSSIFEAVFKDYKKTFIGYTDENHIVTIENSKMTLYSSGCMDSGITTNTVNVQNSFFKLNSTSTTRVYDMGIFTYGSGST